MSKFELEFELTGLKVRIKGEREDIPLITSNLGRQVAGLLEASSRIADGISGSIVVETPKTMDAANVTSPRKPKRRSVSSGIENTDTPPIDFQHDADRFGMPQQGWTTAKKAIWLLHVLESTTTTSRTSGATLCATFNKHFRQAGTILPWNTNRDLGKAKQKRPPCLGEDTTTDPATWYLLEAGKKEAIALIAEALGQTVG